MSARLIAIASAGLVTSVGLNTASSCAALRCRINNFTELDYFDLEDEPVIGALVPWADIGVGLQKLTQMAASAIQEALAASPTDALADIPLILCVAEPGRVGRINDLDQALFAALEQQLGHPLHPDSGIMAAGQASVALAFNHARHLLYDKNHRALLIVAADSLLNRATLNADLEQERLLATDIRAGFIPGEAAGALLIKRPDPNADVQLLLFGLGVAREKALRDNDIPLRGDGLTQAIKTALTDADATADEIDLCIADVSGEDYYFEELILAQQRADILAPLWLPAESLGETGSAIGCIQFAWLLEARRKLYIPGNNALFLSAADDGRRAAMIVAFQYSQAYRAKAIGSPASANNTNNQGATHGA
jgi:3-oxoacyl-[acyl-carrier-protein] synthase I